jgi:hypothetical protein
MEFTVLGNTVSILSDRFSARIENGRLTELTDRSGRRLIETSRSVPVAPLEMLTDSGGVYEIGLGDSAEIETVPAGPFAAEIHIADWEADAVIRVELDPQDGDLLISPSVLTLRKGVAGVRWNLAGIAENLDLVAPFYQGIRMNHADPLITGRHFHWPIAWQASLAILQGKDSGLCISCRETGFKYRAIEVGHGKNRHALCFVAENTGPWNDLQAAGGLTWRLSVHGGRWEEAAGDYKAWLWKAWGLERMRSVKPDWMWDVSLAVSWCPCEAELLDALASRHPPRNTLLHVHDWRTDMYDRYLPRSIPTNQAFAFMQKAKAMGFRFMPHFNHFGFDPRLDDFHMAAPFIRRAVNHRIYPDRDNKSGSIDGWSYLPDAPGSTGITLRIPQGPSRIHSMTESSNATCFCYVHSGLSWWRYYLKRQISKAVAEIGLDTVFIDQTLDMRNTQNGLVENMTTVEGLLALTRETAMLGVAVGGEGRDEISMQWLSVTQAHLFGSVHEGTLANLKELSCPVNHFLFGDLCRAIGYNHLDGDPANQDSPIRMEAHAVLGIIPTLNVRKAEEILVPNPAVRRELERAADSTRIGRA